MDDLTVITNIFLDMLKKLDAWVDPAPEDALLFLQTEVGELVDAYIRARGSKYVRNNPGGADASKVVGEAADVIMMVLVFLRVAYPDSDVKEALVDNLERRYRRAVEQAK